MTTVPDEERLARYEQAWTTGGIIEFLGSYMDHLTNQQSNDLLCEFVRGKIRSMVDDPATAEALCPTTYPIGTKRLCVDTGYYETFNQPHVRLVDLRAHPISTITAGGIDLVDESFEFDVIVFATGFDAMTGAIVGVDIAGRNGLTLKDAWAEGPVTYLGLMAAGFPNLFMITGPGSPSVLSNMMVSIEQHVDWIAESVRHVLAEGLDTIEPTEIAVAGWVQHVNDFASITLMPQANSWYMGANVPGKPRVFLPYAGGVERYRAICDEVVERDYLGLARRGPDGTRCNDGVVRKVQPDVGVMLELMGALDLPAMDTMSAANARAFSTAMSAERPPGPDVGEIHDGVLPAPAEIWPTGSIGRVPPGRIRSSSTSTAAAGYSAATTATTRSVAICACARVPSLFRSTTATRPRRVFLRRSTTRSLRSSGLPPMPRRSVAFPANSSLAAGAPEPT